MKPNQVVPGKQSRKLKGMIAPFGMIVAAGFVVFAAASALWAAGNTIEQVAQAYIPVALNDSGDVEPTPSFTPTLEGSPTPTEEPPTATPTEEPPTATPTEEPATATPTRQPATATPTTTPSGPIGPTITPGAPLPTPKAPEFAIYDWNGLVTKAHKGFPWDQPPWASANVNWTTPYNLAEGRLFFRATINSMPTNQLAKLQFCIWQVSQNNVSLGWETCGAIRNFDFKGEPITVTWFQPIPDMYQKNGQPLDWTRARQRHSAAIKNSQGLPVSNFSDWDWNGEDPDDWYPMNMRFTVVVVEKGRDFSGWQNYP